MAFMSDNAKLNVETVLVIVVAIAALVLVPHGRLRPISVAVVVAVALALLGIKAYLRRLEDVIDFLTTASSANRASGLVALLSEPERKLLRVGDASDAEATIALLKKRQEAITSFGMFVGITGVCAVLVAIITFEF
jgi:hypothetical protein